MENKFGGKTNRYSNSMLMAEILFKKSTVTRLGRRSHRSKGLTDNCSGFSHLLSSSNLLSSSLDKMVEVLPLVSVMFYYKAGMSWQ